MTEMIQCRNCGDYVPVEKAFCPNCSEPIEPEEQPNRAASFSSDMLTTMRDDPDNYRELMAHKPKRAGEAQPAQSAPANAAASAVAAPPLASPSAVSYQATGVAPVMTEPAKNNKLSLWLGLGAAVVIIALVIIFFVLR